MSHDLEMRFQTFLGSKPTGHLHGTKPILTRWLVPIVPILAFILVSLSAGLPSASGMTHSYMSPRDNWLPPVNPPLSLIKGFDPPSERWLAGHRGVDLQSSKGTIVRAPGDGQVHFVGRIVDRHVLSISHGDLRTTYEPVESEMVVGQIVVKGQEIGRVADGGHCHSTCLHWGLIRGDEYLDPLALLKTEPPILKPTR